MASAAIRDNKPRGQRTSCDRRRGPWSGIRVYHGLDYPCLLLGCRPCQMQLYSVDMARSVFFSAPGTDDESERTLYQTIISELRGLGYIIGYDWINDSSDYDNESTTRKAIEAIEAADFVVAETTHPSTSVGSQIAYAQSKQIPVIALTRGNSQDRFFSLTGIDPRIIIRTYTPQTLHTVLADETDNTTRKSLVKFNFISTPQITQRIAQEARRQNLSKSEYLRRLLSEYFNL